MDKSSIVSGKFLSIGLGISSKVSVPFKWFCSVSGSCLIVISKLEVTESISWNILDFTGSASSLDGIANNIGSSCISLWENCNAICVKSEFKSIRLLNSCLGDSSLSSGALFGNSGLFSGSCLFSDCSGSTISSDNSLLSNSILRCLLGDGLLGDSTRFSDSCLFSDEGLFSSNLLSDSLFGDCGGLL